MSLLNSSPHSPGSYVEEEEERLEEAKMTGNIKEAEFSRHNRTDAYTKIIEAVKTQKSCTNLSTVKRVDTQRHP